MNNIEDNIDKVLSEKKVEKTITMTIIEDKKQIPDTYQEQIESPMTTIHCPESIKKEDLKNIDKKPENYIEINMVKNIRIVDNFFIPSDKKKFTYKKVVYDIVEKNIYIWASKKDFFVMTAFYHEDKKDPITFTQKNKGITGKALTTLYTPEFYQGLHDHEKIQYNLYVVFLTIVSICAYGIGLYFLITNILGLI